MKARDRAAATEVVIEVKGLRKAYGRTEAVRGIDLTVLKGEVFALLGPNGAGKTTTVEILEGHRPRSSGDVNVLGHDPSKNDCRFKQRIGIVLQTTGVEPYLTAEETIELFRGYYPKPRPVSEILDAVGLTEQRRTRVRRLSGGQQRRLDVAVGLAGDPELLFLDEPTTGFDPSARHGAWEMVKSLQSLGKTVFLTTHYMEEADFLADRVAIIVRGKIVAEGAPGELPSREAETAISFRLASGAGSLPESLSDSTKSENGKLTMRASEPTRTLYELTGWASRRGIELLELTVSRATLEDTYLSIVRDADVEEGEE